VLAPQPTIDFPGLDSIPFQSDARYAFPTVDEISDTHVRSGQALTSVHEIRLPRTPKPVLWDARIATARPRTKNGAPIARTIITMRRLTATDRALSQAEATHNLAEDVMQDAADRGTHTKLRDQNAIAAAGRHAARIALDDVSVAVVQYIHIHALDGNPATLAANEDALARVAAGKGRQLTPLYRLQGRGIVTAGPFGSGLK
jgi:hypothetical protein